MAEENDLKRPAADAAGEPSVHMSADTQKKLADFENKLYQQMLEDKRAAMPDTSIHRTGGSELDAVDHYYPKHDVPIYSSGMNKQIDRVDMELDKAKRSRRGDFLDPDAARFVRQLRAQEEGKTEEEIEAERVARHKKDSRFIIIVPIVIVVIAFVFIGLSMTFGS